MIAKKARLLSPEILQANTPQAAAGLIRNQLDDLTARFSPKKAGLVREYLECCEYTTKDPRSPTGFQDIVNGYLPSIPHLKRKKELEKENKGLTFEFRTAALLARAEAGWLPAEDFSSQLSNFRGLQTALGISKKDPDGAPIKMLEGSIVSLFMPLNDPTLKYTSKIGFGHLISEGNLQSSQQSTLEKSMGLR